MQKYSLLVFHNDYNSIFTHFDLTFFVCFKLWEPSTVTLRVTYVVGHKITGTHLIGQDTREPPHQLTQGPPLIIPLGVRL